MRKIEDGGAGPVLGRRALLRSGLAAGTLAAVGGGNIASAAPPASPAPGPAAGTLIRQAFNTLTSAQIEALRAGVRVMKERPLSDPTSWWYQANIHGTYLTPSDPLAKATWIQCPHGGYYFFPWHRMYLYWFERILRAAAQDQSLTLPYWNYTNPKYLALPEAFRVPASGQNSLWTVDRLPYVDADAGINVNVGGGDPMPWSLIDPSAAWPFQNFCASAGSVNSFGSTQGPWHHLPPPAGFGQLETQPHNQVHNLVGGYIPDAQANGAMTDVNKAANDPIFWFHHANIDRLWGYWISLQGQRSDPTADHDWMNHPFTFVDEKGKPQQNTPAEVLNTLELGYAYDTLNPLGDAVLTSVSAESAAPIVACTETATPQLLASAVGSAKAPALKLTRGRSSTKLAVKSQALQLEATAAKPIRLVLRNVSTTSQSKIVPIYINLPEGVAPSVEGPYYAGSISLFGGGSSGVPVQFDRAIAIDAILKRQSEQGLYKGGPITVTVAGNVPAGLSVAEVRIER